jgi:hypothetical protein
MVPHPAPGLAITGFRYGDAALVGLGQKNGNSGSVRRMIHQTSPAEVSHVRATRRHSAGVPPSLRVFWSCAMQPPAGLHRIPGADAILWFLHQDAALASEHRPRSATTIWKILDHHQRIHRRTRPPHQTLDRPASLEEIELDFTDVGSIPRDPEDKRQHVAETFTWVDRGASRPMAARVRADFHIVDVSRSATPVDASAAGAAWWRYGQKLSPNAKS